MSNPPEKRYAVRGSVYEIHGNGADGAYDLLTDNASPEEIGVALAIFLRQDWGLTNSKGPFRLTLHIGPAGMGDELPLG